MTASLPTASKAADWIVRLRPVAEPQVRLIGFMNAGGSVALFRNWHEHLPATIEVCPVQIPGQGSRFREQPYTRLQPLVQTLAEVITPYLDKPFVFWGYSMGALITFELARELRRRGQPVPEHLFITARRAPHLPAPDSPLHTLHEAAFIQEMQRRYNGIPAAVLQEKEMLALFLPVLRSNFEMIETYEYTPEAPLPCPISAFGGLQDPTVNADEIAAWQQHTSSAFQYAMFPGDHFFMQNHLATVLHSVAEDLLPLLK